MRPHFRDKKTWLDYYLKAGTSKPSVRFKRGAAVATKGNHTAAKTLATNDPSRCNARYNLRTKPHTRFLDTTTIIPSDEDNDDEEGDDDDDGEYDDTLAHVKQEQAEFDGDASSEFPAIVPS